MWLWDTISKSAERWARHYTGLIKLWHSTNEQLAAIHNAIYEINEVLAAYRDAIAKRNIIPMAANQPEEVPIDSSFLLDIMNLDLVNAFAAYRHNLTCANRDIRRLSGIKRDLERGFAEGRLQQRDYLENLTQLVRWLEELRAHLTALLDDATTLTAMVRVRAQRDISHYHKIVMKLRRTGNESDFAEATLAERARVVAEIETLSGRSAERIEAVRKGTYSGAR
jgi:hypothetical protein